MTGLQADIILAVLAALIAGLIGVWSNAWLSRRNKRIDERVKFLTEAYFDLEFGWPRRHEELGEDAYSDEELGLMYQRFNKAIVAINLFGTPDQIELCRKEFSMPQFDLTPLVVSLRDSLRKELRLEALAVGHFWYEARLKKRSVNGK
jgi:hypothetical protein